MTRAELAAEISRRRRTGLWEWVCGPDYAPCALDTTCPPWEDAIAGLAEHQKRHEEGR